jgi:PAS domain S-box-containing protein
MKCTPAFHFFARIQMKIDERLKVLLDQLPALVAYWDQHLINQYGNKAYLEWFGITPQDMQGRHLSQVIGPQLFEANRAYIEGALQGQTQTFARTLTDSKGVKRHTQAHYFPDIEHGEVHGFFVLVSDISDLQRVSDELREAQRIGQLGSWTWHAQTDETTWSPELYRLLGRNPNLPPTSGAELSRYYSKESCHALHACVAHALATGEPYTLEMQFIRDDGSTGWLTAKGQAVCNQHGQIEGLRGTAQDISQRKKIESELMASRNELRDMVAHHEVACEEERKHIAREVHDELGQLLTAMRMDLALLRPHGSDNAQVDKLVRDMDSLVNAMFKVARGVVTSLRPAALDAGLVAALEWLAQDFSARSGLACKVDARRSDLPIKDTLAGVIFRIIQESLTNVARHAQATQVWVTLSDTPHNLYVMIQDDGQGFDAEAASHQPGYGLLSMRERVLSLGGHARIDSRPGQGTTIFIDVPL